MKKVFYSFIAMAVILIAENNIFKATGAALACMAVAAFFTGFLPVFIYEALKEMQPDKLPGTQPFYNIAATGLIWLILITLTAANPHQKATETPHRAPQKAAAAVTLLTKKAVKKPLKKHHRAQNYKVIKCSHGYYIAGTIPNGYNSTF